MPRMAGWCVGNCIHWAFPVHNGNGQLIHTFQPSSLSSTYVRLRLNIHPWFMISIYHHWYTINITTPFYACLVYWQQLFFSPILVAFCQSVLATMVSLQMQTIIILLQQYSPGCITTCISVNHKWHLKIGQA